MNFLYHIFGTFLYFLYSLVHNYGIAIILFTITVKLILLPLNIKSTKSLQETQKLTLVQQYLQKKYKNNPDKLSQETAALYKIYKVNPMGGCLPLLIQLPIIYGLFGALRNPAEYVFQNGNLQAINQSFLWIPNLSQPDPYYILPILCVVFTWLTQKFTNTVAANDNPQTESTQKLMQVMMPLLIGFMALSLPAGVGLYWVIQSIFTFVQQFLMLRKPVEKISVHDAELALEKYHKNQRSEIKVARKMDSERRNAYLNNTTKPKKSTENKPSVKMKPASGKKIRKTITKIPERK